MTDTSQAPDRKADRSRRRLTGLMDDLQSQISPGQMLDQVLGFNNVEGSTSGHSIPQQISKHPLPYLIIAAGIGWLMLSKATEKVRSGRATKQDGEKVLRKDENRLLSKLAALHTSLCKV